MFTSVDDAWNMEDITLSCSAATVFSLTSSTGVELVNFFAVDVAICNKLATVDGLGALAINRMVVSNIITSGITFLNNINIFSMHQSLVVASSGDIFDLGTATFNTFLISNASLTVNGSANILKGVTGSANINSGGLGSMLNARQLGTGTSLIGITTDDALWQFLLNDDITDTRPDALLHAEAQTVIIGAVNTPVKVGGTWVDVRSAQFTNDTGGKTTYDGGKSLVVPLTFSANVEPVSGTNKNFNIYVAINGSVVVASSVPGRADSGSPQNLTIVWQEVISPTDFIELFIENTTDAINFTINHATMRVN